MPHRNGNGNLPLTFGQRLSDRITGYLGSWTFIVSQSILLTCWIVANVYFLAHPGAFRAWDPYPFILLNLTLSFQAAYTGPIVLMSQNRQSERDRRLARDDYDLSVEAERHIQELQVQVADLLQRLSQTDYCETCDYRLKIKALDEQAESELERLRKEIAVVSSQLESLSARVRPNGKTQ